MSKIFDGKIFDERKISEYEKDFLNYLDGLSTEGNLFGCSYLRTLSQGIKIIYSDRPSQTFEKGTLICYKSAEGNLNPRCGLESDLEVDDLGNLSLICKRKMMKFEVNLLRSAENE